jgi:hypothetical protein
LAGRHARSACHSLAALAAVALSIAGCAPSQGWQRSDARACAPGDAPIVCLQPGQDRADEVALGGTVLVPHECARAPSGSHGGPLRLQVTGRKGRVERRFIRVPKGSVTIVRIDAKGRPELQTRHRCDGLPVI